MSEVLAQLEKKGGGTDGELVTTMHLSAVINNKTDTFTCNSSGTFYYSFGGFVSNYPTIKLNGVTQAATWNNMQAQDYYYGAQYQFAVEKGDTITRTVNSSGHTIFTEQGVIL